MKNVNKLLVYMQSKVISDNLTRNAKNSSQRVQIFLEQIYNQNITVQRQLLNIQALQQFIEEDQSYLYTLDLDKIQYMSRIPQLQEQMVMLLINYAIYEYLPDKVLYQCQKIFECGLQLDAENLSNVAFLKYVIILLGNLSSVVPTFCIHYYNLLLPKVLYMRQQCLSIAKQYQINSQKQLNHPFVPTFLDSAVIIEKIAWSLCILIKTLETPNQILSNNFTNLVFSQNALTKTAQAYLSSCIRFMVERQYECTNELELYQTVKQFLAKGMYQNCLHIFINNFVNANPDMLQQVVMEMEDLLEKSENECTMRTCSIVLKQFEEFADYDCEIVFKMEQNLD
ncbi:Hypothetical_protein [Hexamita inflata]|uniref:Hypothetical_protein n=1 Tax=Hexamita inflata TaxID=28002 RepID=A0AA86TX94_9EUKA|nr:Hypothetical protein HINF_LOCUS18092 [Hexamita inflata]